MGGGEGEEKEAVNINSHPWEVSLWIEVEQKRIKGRFETVYNKDGKEGQGGEHDK
jgi:hypothetical protein